MLKIKKLFRFAISLRTIQNFDICQGGKVEEQHIILLIREIIL